MQKSLTVKVCYGSRLHALATCRLCKSSDSPALHSWRCNQFQELELCWSDTTPCSIRREIMRPETEGDMFLKREMVDTVLLGYHLPELQQQVNVSLRVGFTGSKLVTDGRTCSIAKQTTSEKNFQVTIYLSTVGLIPPDVILWGCSVGLTKNWSYGIKCCGTITECLIRLEGILSDREIVALLVARNKVMVDNIERNYSQTSLSRAQRTSSNLHSNSQSPVPVPRRQTPFLFHTNGSDFLQDRGDYRAREAASPEILSS
ncbi:hypothetical protein J6590_031069 [Homalodisca vitripennis]|nr:hypothetical protein J6590_031069 [Homalodisca vitripennis]